MFDVVVVFVVVVTFVQALSPLRRDAFLETPSLRVTALMKDVLDSDN